MQPYSCSLGMMIKLMLKVESSNSLTSYWSWPGLAIVLLLHNFNLRNLLLIKCWESFD